MFDKYIGKTITDMEYNKDQNLIILLDDGTVLEVCGEPSYDGNNGVYIPE